MSVSDTYSEHPVSAAISENHLSLAAESGFIANGYDSRLSVYNAIKPVTMQTTLASPAAGRTAGQALRAYAGQLIDRINSLNERTWLNLGAVFTLSTILSAGRFSATGAGSDAVFLALASLTSLCMLAKADSINSERKSDASK